MATMPNKTSPELAVIGTRQKRLDGFEKVSGRSVFTDDVRLPGMLRTYELPEVDYVLVETIDPYGPFGAKEVGEGPIIVSMSAIASAVMNALGGNMVPEIPMTPWRMQRMLNIMRRNEQAGEKGTGKKWSEGISA